MLVEGADQPLRAAGLQHRAEFRAPVGKLADRAVEIDVDDPPVVARLAHQIAERDRLAVRLNDLRLDDLVAIFLIERLQDEELLSGETVEAAGIGRRSHAYESTDDRLPLLLRQRITTLSNGDPRHQRQVVG